MLLNAFFSLLFFSVISFVLCIIGAAIAYFTQESEIASGLFYSWIRDFNGILVGGVGYGLMWFVIHNGKAILNQLNNLLEIPEGYSPALVRINRKATSWLWLNMISVPMTVLGGFVLWNCGYPLVGFAKLYLAVCSMSIYYVASLTLAFFIYTLWLFMFLEDKHNELKIQKWAFVRGFDNLNSFFIISATFGILGVYLGFRGTLTANFSYPSDFFRKILILPIIAYLPAALLYSFYPRYVLRRISEHDTYRKIEQLESEALNSKQHTVKEKLEMEKILMDIKEKLLDERKAIPILSIKDTPSLLLSLLMIIQFIIQKDSVIVNFLKIFW